MKFRAGLTVLLSLFISSQHSPADAATQSDTFKPVQNNQALLPQRKAASQARQKPIVLAQSMTRAEAFAASKDLNTIDGWNAYLKQYPEGFRADLARAYIKKLSRLEGGNGNVDDDNKVSASQEDPAKPAKPRFLRTRNAAIEGHDRKRLYDRSVEECLLACANETEFVCKSVDYYKTRNSCNLSDTTASEVGGLKRDYANNPFDYYKRVINVETSRPSPRRRESSERSQRSEDTSLSRRVSEMNCEGGSIRGGECRCPEGIKRVTNADNDYSCVGRTNSRPKPQSRETVSKTVCTNGYVSRGRCRCNSSRVRVKTGNRRYKCVRKKTTTRKKPWLKYKNPWNRKDCGSLIPGCIRECAKGDSNCKLNCNQMCSGA